MNNYSLNNDILYIVMPAYNEQDLIESVVKDWYKILELASPKSKLVIADNGSTDMTHQILLDLKKELPKIVIINDTLQYHGAKLIKMYKYAIDNEATWIFQTDSDGQTNSEEFIKFWNDRIKYDAIIGNRRIRGDGLWRKFVENVVCLLLRIYFGIRLQDANAPFRLMKSNLLKKYIYRFKEDYNLPNIMLSTYFAYYKENVCYKEITFKTRQGGINSINFKKIFKIGINALNDFKHFKKDMIK